ncbi:hypothetical protein EV13_3059 [Prochlorococcus sp. MIT 0702]|uniref:hypothetical protein n=1 Tax=unclassified Prochlorococcus TaxID=2627481 RepID=UPI000533AAB2|nr:MULTISPECIES: hypothetical protein [unclassified Prochlorococcus]KGG25726.1 hypothetical protein EV13_3059 [Prochlorococcus sp. MIT 0702]
MSLSAKALLCCRPQGWICSGLLSALLDVPSTHVFSLLESKRINLQCAIGGNTQ